MRPSAPTTRSALSFLSIFTNPVYFNDPEGIHTTDGWIKRGEEFLLPEDRVALPGAQNLSNACAALAAVECLGIEPGKCTEALTSFRPLPHRLSPLGEKQGVLYVDDSLSTIPQATMAAVAAYPDRPITVLLGGLDRGIEIEGLARFLVEKPVHAVITMSQTGPRIAAAIRQIIRRREPATIRTHDGRTDEGPTHGGPLLHEAEDLVQAVDHARRVTPKGGVVLLSPAAPSYADFRSFEERAEAFARAAGGSGCSRESGSS